MSHNFPTRLDRALAAGGHESGARRLLEATRFSGGHWQPRSRDTGRPLPVSVCFLPFQWDDDETWHWLVVSLGVSDVAQRDRSRGDTALPERVEICTLFADPRDSLAPLREMWGDGQYLPGVPSMIEQFAMLANDFADWIGRGSCFYYGDTIDDWPWLSPLPFTGAVVMPPCPELACEGLLPWTCDGDRVVAADADNFNHWLDREELCRRGPNVFLQIAPLYADELAVARDGLGWAFVIGGLVASDEEIEAGADASAFIADIARPSRLAAFETWRAAQSR